MPPPPETKSVGMIWHVWGHIQDMGLIICTEMRVAKWSSYNSYASIWTGVQALHSEQQVEPVYVITFMVYVKSSKMVLIVILLPYTISFNSLGLARFLKEVSYAHQSSIYLIKK